MSIVLQVPTREPAEPYHAVHFYEKDEQLFPVVTQFLEKGFKAGDAVVVIAGPEHRETFRSTIAEHGIDVDLAIRSGQFTLIDAREALATFMVDGQPDANRFEAVIGGAIDKSGQTWRSRVRAYGEMVDLLWQDGEHSAAIQLEELWNNLLERKDVALLCAYGMGNFYNESTSHSFADVCGQHTTIVRADSEPAFDNRQLERALRDALTARTRAEAELRDFVQKAPVGLHWVGPDGTILWANDAELKMLGYARGEYIGRNIRDFYVEPREVEEILTFLRNNEEIHDREVRLRAKDGSTKYALVTSNAKFENGHFKHTRCFTRDNTGVRLEQKKFKRLMESNIIGIFTRTEDGRVLEANQPFLRLIGYQHDDVATGRLRWTDMTPPEYRQKDLNAIAEVQRYGECTPYEKELIRRDGTRVPVLLGAARLHGATHIAYAIDLTDRKTAERDAGFLAEASEIVSRTLDSKEVLRSIAELFVPRFAEYCFVDMTREDGAIERTATAGEEPQKFAEGRSLTVTLAAHGTTFGIIGFVGAPSRRPFDKRDLALAQEVARRAALAIDHARLYESAQNANRAKDEFLATLSHELRTPMTAILGWSRFLQIGKVDGETLNNAIEAISRAAVVQAQIIDDVLDMSRIISGKLRLELEPMDIASVINAAVETVRPTMMAKQIVLDVKNETGIEMVWGDSARLQQAIWNLLSNATKFTPAGGKVTVSVVQSGPLARISVTDTGQGIDPAFLPHVFERFRQAESTSTRAYGGLGLGLAIVRYIVEMHGGRITAASDGPGTGATFTIELPTLAGVTVHAQSKPRDQYVDLTGIRVLFADDETETRVFVRTVLEHCGAQVRDCSSAAEALIVADQWQPNVVITDIMMPNEDGISLARQLKTRDGSIPVLALTAGGIRKAEADFMEFLTKPIDPLELAQAVKRANG